MAFSVGSWSAVPRFEKQSMAPLCAAVSCACGKITREQADSILSKCISNGEMTGVTHENAEKYMDALIKYASLD